MSLSSPAMRRALLGLAGAGGFVTWLAATTTSPVPTPPLSDGSPSFVSATSPPAALAAETTFAALVERPLFQPSRRPANPLVAAPPPPVATPLPPPPAGGVLGIVIGPRRLAILRSDGKNLVVSEGDAVAGWRIERIDPDRVVLATGDRTTEWFFARHHDQGSSSAMSSSAHHAPLRRRL